MIGYLTLLHPVDRNGALDRSAVPIFCKLLEKLDSGENQGHYGLLSSHAPHSVKDEHYKDGKLPYYAGRTVSPGFVAHWCSDDLGSLPGSFAFARVEYRHTELVEESDTRFLEQPRVAVCSEALTTENQNMLAQTLDQYTIDALGPESPLGVRVGQAVLAQEKVAKHPFDMTSVIAPSSIVFHAKESGSSHKLYLFIVWVGGSVFLLWHSNSDLVMEAVQALNQDGHHTASDNVDVIDREALRPTSTSMTIGFSCVPVRSVLSVNYSVLLRALVRDISRAGPRSLRLSATVARILYRILRTKVPT